MKYLFTLFVTFLIACGGGGSSIAINSGANPSSTPTGVSGLSGSISDIEIIDVD